MAGRKGLTGQTSQKGRAISRKGYGAVIFLPDRKPQATVEAQREHIVAPHMALEPGGAKALYQSRHFPAKRGSDGGVPMLGMNGKATKHGLNSKPPTGNNGT